MHRIQKLSRSMVYLLSGLIILVPLCTLLMWFFNQWSPWPAIFSKSMTVDTPDGMINLWSLNLTSTQRFVGICGSFTGLLPLLLGLIVLKKLFQNYYGGHIFTLENADRYKKLGILFFLHALIAQPLQGLLMVLAATLSNPPGHRFITIGFGTPNLEAIFCGVLVIVISWVMAEAQKLQDEQQLTV